MYTCVHGPGHAQHLRFSFTILTIANLPSPLTDENPPTLCIVRKRNLYTPPQNMLSWKTNPNLGPKYGLGDWLKETRWMHEKNWYTWNKNPEIVVKHTNLEVVETHEWAHLICPRLRGQTENRGGDAEIFWDILGKNKGIWSPKHGVKNTNWRICQNTWLCPFNLVPIAREDIKLGWEFSKIWQLSKTKVKFGSKTLIWEFVKSPRSAITTFGPFNLLPIEREIRRSGFKFSENFHKKNVKSGSKPQSWEFVRSIQPIESAPNREGRPKIGAAMVGHLGRAEKKDDFCVKNLNANLGLYQNTTFGPRV